MAVASTKNDFVVSYIESNSYPRLSGAEHLPILRKWVDAASKRLEAKSALMTVGSVGMKHVFMPWSPKRVKNAFHVF
jgi:hypothetical protein